MGANKKAVINKELTPQLETHCLTEIHFTNIFSLPISCFEMCTRSTLLGLASAYRNNYQKLLSNKTIHVLCLFKIIYLEIVIHDTCVCVCVQSIYICTIYKKCILKYKFCFYINCPIYSLSGFHQRRTSKEVVTRS